MNDEILMQAIDPNWKEKRVREYKQDRVLEEMRNRMFEVHCYAQPRILININSPKDSIFDIDPGSKNRIKWWVEKMREYIRNNYSDIINADEIFLND